MKYLLIFLLLTGCMPSPTDTIKAFIPGDDGGVKVDTEITAGDKQIKTGITGKSEVSSTTITADSVIYNNSKPDKGISIWSIFQLIMVAFFIGVAMPSYRQMLLMITGKNKVQTGSI